MIEVIGILALMSATTITLYFFMSLSLVVRRYREEKDKHEKIITPTNSTVEEWENSKEN